MSMIEKGGYLKDNHPEYNAAMEKRRSVGKPSAYGEEELKMYRECLALQAQGKTKRNGKPLEGELDSSFEWMRKYMARDLDDVYRGKGYQRFLNSALADPQIGPELRPFIAMEGGQLDIDKARTFLNDWQNHNGLWAKILERHVRQFQERAKEMAKKAEQARQEFLLAAQRAIEAGELPVTLELLRQRVDETVIYIRDHIKDPGMADYKDTVATISDNLKESNIKHAIFHELTHALSGRIIAKNKIGVFPTIDHIKIGLMFTSRDTKVAPHAKRIWLNEALTERQALKLEGRSVDDDAEYPLERAGLANLLQRGISEELMYRAYYENYDPETKAGLPAWKELMGALRENEAAQKHLRFLDSAMEG